MKKLLIACAAAALGLSAAAQTVELDTSLGPIYVKLNADKAPKTVANFVRYVKAGHYDGTVFHRVIDGFMIQGGGYDIQLRERPTLAPIPLESHNGLSNVRGAIAMARTNEPHSAAAQFFINVVDNPRLDGEAGDANTGYAVFGQVLEGMDVVDAIRSLPVAPMGMHQHLPTAPILVNHARIVPDRPEPAASAPEADSADPAATTPVSNPEASAAPAAPASATLK